MDYKKTLFRDGLKHLEPFDPIDHTDVVRLYLNEGLAHDDAFADRFAERVRKLLKDERYLNWYGEVNPEGLMKAYANYLGVPSQHVEITSGSSESILMLALACFTENKRIAYPTPSYYLFEKCIQLFGAKGVPYAVPVSMDEQDPKMRTSLFSKEVMEAEIVILCRPNNPTGSVIPEAWVEEFLKSYQGTVIIDEAYQEFAEAMGVHSFVKKTALYPNLIVLRTMSKAFGAAGLRVGAIVAHPDIIYNLAKVRTYRMSIISQYLGEWMLTEESENMRRRVADTIRIKADWAARLSEIKGVEVFPTYTNFILMRHPKAAALADYLLKQGGFAVRLLGGGVLDNTLRPSVPEAAHVERFIKAVRDFTEQN
jgi:histidinol-phosphate aminotransferase